MARTDDRTPDLFLERQPAEPGSLACSVEIAHTMAEAVKASPHDRETVADRMSRFIGHRVTVAMLNAYTAESRETHNVSLERAIAFDHATETYSLLKLHARKCGAIAVSGRDALLVEWARNEQERRDNAERARALAVLLRKS